MKSKSFKITVLTFISVAFLSLSWPPYPIFFLAFFGFIPILMIHELLQGKWASLIFWCIVFCILFSWQSISIYWLYETKFSAGLLTNSINSLILSVPFLAYTLCRSWSKLTRQVLFVSLFLSIELLHFNWKLGFPFFTLGNSLGMYPSLIQWYEITGVMGGSLWILVLNILGFEMIQHRFGRKPLIVFSSGLLIPVLVSLSVFHFYKQSPRKADILVIHPNVDVDVKYEMKTSVLIDKYCEITKGVIDEKLDLVVWPESAIPKGGWIEDIQVNEDLNYIRRNFVEYPNLTIATGALMYRLYSGNDLESDKYHLRYLQTHQKYFSTHSVAINLNYGNWKERTRVKSKLVPIEEGLPYAKLLGFLQDLVGSLGGFRFSVIENPTNTFVFSRSTAGYLICYESAFHSPASEMVDEGAKLFLIGLNEGWYNNQTAASQFLYLSTVRAIEYRRSVARSSNRGISSLTNSKGEIISSSGEENAAHLRGTLDLSHRKTLFFYLGDYIGGLSVTLFMGLILVSIYRNRSNLKQ